LQARSKEQQAKNSKQRTASKEQQAKNSTSIDQQEMEQQMQNFIRDEELSGRILKQSLLVQERIANSLNAVKEKKLVALMKDERGDVPGWVLVVLMTTGLVTAIWTIAAPRLSAILKNSLDAMNGIR
jgi:hypothetical protein